VSNPIPPAEEGLSVDRIKGALEALLLVASEPLSPRRAATVLDLPESQARTCLRLLADDYSRRESGLAVIEVGGGFRLVSRPEFDELVARLEPSRVQTQLSGAAVETLAIVAYNQPLTRMDVEAIRGVRCEGVLATLCDRGLVEEVGRKEGPGRPILYGTTRRFLEFVGLVDLSHLPPLPPREEAEASG
jgi:segregation and condensation protein B